MAEPSRYPPIGDYGYIGDGHAAALVSSRGSIDWCCMPRMDSSSVFGRLLDWDEGGYCEIAPVDGATALRRHYVEDTMVLVTTIRTHDGEARLIDCFTMREGGRDEPHRQLLRVVEGVRGAVDLRVHVAVRFDYGATRPWLRRHGTEGWTASGGDNALLVVADSILSADDGDLTSRITVTAKERQRLSISWVHPEDLDDQPAPAPDELDERLDRTVQWWRGWTARAQSAATQDDDVRRSALVLKALINAPTGAIAAAPTTSLPEAVGQSRNWDYRYSWVRDSQFIARSLAELGHDAEADGFRRFIERTAGGDPSRLQIMYGLDGRRRLDETTLPLDGYRGSRPVRIGNAAASQLQLGTYGEILELAWLWHNRGNSPDDDYWRFLLGVVDDAAERWQEPDHGIWEMRGDPQHFVHSKVMCWAALDRGLRLAEECLRRAPTRRWRAARHEIRESVDEHGVDPKRNCFVQVYGGNGLDAALLLIPSVRYVPYDDARVTATVDAVVADLDDEGLLRRYRADDGLNGDEGVFVACSFWLAECLARQNRTDEARAVYARVAATANDLGLFAEEFDPRRHELLGNFPQGLSHLSQIAAAVALSDSD